MSEEKKYWKTCQLGEIIELKRGYDLPQQNRKPGRVPIVSSSGISDYHDEVKVCGPGVVTGRYGTIGQVFFINQDFWPLNTTLYVRDFKGNSPLFINYFLKTFDFLSCSDKAAVPGVNRNHLHQMTVNIPPLPTQKAIAHILGTLDDKIELNRRMNETLESIARAIFTSWFIDFDPVRAKAEGRQPEGMDATTAALFPSEFETVEGQEIPKGWRIKAIGDVVEIKGGSTPSTKNLEFWDGNIPFCTPKDLANNKIPFLLKTERNITDLGVKEISSGILPTETVLLSSRAPIGYIAITSYPVCINQGFIAIIPNKLCSNTFLFEWLKENIDIIIGNANGTTFLEISKKNFRPLLMILPPVDIMVEFQKVSEILFNKILSNLNQSLMLTEIRDTLLPKLLSGELQIDKPEAFLEATT